MPLRRCTVRQPSAGSFMSKTIVSKIEWGALTGQRPRRAGRNARLGEHGQTVRVPLARITLSDGTSGFGPCRAMPAHASEIIGLPFDTVFRTQAGVAAVARDFDYALWDLCGHLRQQPVYALAAAMYNKPAPVSLRVPCYDTSLYFDDLDCANDEEASKLIADEAQQGWARGQRAFKIKVGRGARHMPIEAGMRRDIAVIRAVRAATGAESPIMIDANNGYTLNIAKQVLHETADCKVFWIEEALHEDSVLYEDLRDWIKANGLSTLIADGEGDASARLVDWAREGLVQVLQYDYLDRGITEWLALGNQLDQWHVWSAPHHYGGHLGNYLSGHFAAAIREFAFVEWDEASTPGIQSPGYTVIDGQVHIPDSPGFALHLDEAAFQRAVHDNGRVVSSQSN